MNITRRAALKGGTATVAAIAATGAVAARVAVDDPLVTMEQLWHRITNTADRTCDLYEDDEQIEPLLQRRDRLEAEITKTPARSVEGIAVKLRLFVHHAPIDPNDGDFVDDFLIAALRDAERLAGRAQS